jgi:SAM-dependent methyltransferase
MPDFKLINEFINEFENNRSTAHLIDIIDTTRPLGLGYGHIYHSIRASSIIEGFNGRRILEMGGALPDKYVFNTLKAKRWVAVEYHEYIGNQHKNNYDANYSYDNTGWEGFYNKWKATDGQNFDVIYSIAAFEHIHNLNGCLESIHEMLCDGGILYAYFTPIWSAQNGAHGFHPKEIDVFGNHCHLFFDYSSIQDHLVGQHGVDRKSACAAAHELYKNNQINRYSYEEYIKIFEASQFKEKRVIPIGLESFDSLYTGERLERIKAFHPQMKMSCAGFEVVMRK